jgi:hypothetical protein
MKKAEWKRKWISLSLCFLALDRSSSYFVPHLRVDDEQILKDLMMVVMRGSSYWYDTI